MAAGGAGGSEGDRAVVTNVVSASKRGSMMEQGKLVKYHEVPVHRFCERWLYRYGGDSAEQVSEQKRMPFKVVPATEVDSDHRLAIADWHETKGKGESFVEYRIQVQSGNHGPSWDVWHRYSDFEKLHEKLFKGNGEKALRWCRACLPLACAPAHQPVAPSLGIWCLSSVSRIIPSGEDACLGPVAAHVSASLRSVLGEGWPRSVSQTILHM